MLSEIDKQTLLEKLRQQARAQLHDLTQSQRVSQAGATHEETRAEDPKDTRATEASYLARGLAERAEQLEAELERLNAFAAPAMASEDVVKPGALVRVEEAEGGAETIYFLLPAGGGEVLSLGEVRVRVLSPRSPIGRALVGREVGDDFSVDLPRGRMTFFIAELC